MHHGIATSVREFAAPRAAFANSRSMLLERLLHDAKNNKIPPLTIATYVECLDALGTARLERLADDGEVCLMVLLVASLLSVDGLLKHLDAAFDGAELLLEHVSQRRDLRGRVIADDGLLAHELL
ncbi:hypothetical protein GQ600_27444 [Phytophthora cactorum]|nr:hypothetical protein GQ600_27444 [Phytophthora cactorum]